MGKVNIEEKVQFLVESYNVFDSSNVKDLETKLNEEVYTELRFLTRDGFVTQKINGLQIKLSSTDDDMILSIIPKVDIGDKIRPIKIEGKVLGILGLKNYYPAKFVYDTKDFYVSDDIFYAMLEADPSKNKMNTQWMLNVFSRYSKLYNDDHSITKAIQFSTEDLAMAKDYLILFEQHKRKQKFKNLCNASPLLKRIKDVTNINQYKALDELFDAVDPFIEKDTSGLLKDMQRYVNSGEAEMPIKDRNFTLFLPKSRDANVLFNKLASWCTTSPGNGMYNSYTSQKTPDGKDSNMYIIVDNKVFSGESDKVWQLHFESGQYKDKSNSSNINVYDNILKKSDTLFLYFKEELTRLARLQHAKNGEIERNIYVKIAREFGIVDTYLEMLPKNSPQIAISNTKLKQMGDMSKFRDLLYLTMINCEIDEFHPSIGGLKKLKVLSMFDNNIKKLPEELSRCKNLSILTLTNNPIEEIPDSISALDRTNGGSLITFAYSKNKITKKALKRLQELLPSVKFNTAEE